jgi:hypothetical protein
MANERNIRLERQAETRASDSWLPQSSLPVPEPKDGWVFRWIRTSSLGRSDNTNVSRQFREGWEPVKAEDHPELKIMSDINSQFKGNVEVGGLLLCKAPVELMRQRRSYFSGKNQSQMESVDNNFMRESDARMPLFREKKSSTSFGKGR